MAYVVQGNVNGKLYSKEDEYGLVVIFSLTHGTHTYSIIGKYRLQKWYPKIISYKKTNAQSQITKQLLNASQENIQRDKVPSTECYAEIREPLLENSFS